MIPTELKNKFEKTIEINNIDWKLIEEICKLSHPSGPLVSVSAEVMGDYDEMMNVYDDMIEFNKRHPEAAITPESIERSMKRHAETTENMHYGASFSTTYGAAIQEIRDAFKQ